MCATTSDCALLKSRTLQRPPVQCSLSLRCEDRTVSPRSGMRVTEAPPPMTARSTDGLQRAAVTRPECTSPIRRLFAVRLYSCSLAMHRHLLHYAILPSDVQHRFGLVSLRPTVSVHRGHHVAREKHAAHRPPNTCCGNLLLTQFQRPTASLQSRYIA